MLDITRHTVDSQYVQGKNSFFFSYSLKNSGVLIENLILHNITTWGSQVETTDSSMCFLSRSGNN